MAGPVIQVIDRQEYKNHYLATLPEDPLPAELAPSSIRVRTQLFTLSTNNITYARLGHWIGWWDVHPMPENTPAPYNDTTKYGRLSCWGIGVVTASTSPLVATGTKIYGYLPVGTLEVDKEITEAEPGVKSQFIETTEYRKDIMQGFYNRYYIEPADASEYDLAWDAVAKVLFETGYTLSRWGLTWDPEVHKPVYPFGNHAGTWSAEQADIRDTIVLVFAASSKTAATFAQQIAVGRPKEHRPRKLIGVGSAASKAFTERFGWFDDVFLYSDDPIATLKQKAGLDKNTKVFIIEYGGRDLAAWKWASKIKDEAKSLTFLAGSSAPDAGMSLPDVQSYGVDSILATTSGLQVGAIECLGAGRYFDEFEEAWATFKKNGGLPGVELKIKDGLEPFYNDWIGLIDGSVPGTDALLYRI